MKHSKRKDSDYPHGSASLYESLTLLDDLGCAGLVITPDEPTYAMLHAGATAGGISPKQAERVYQAMVRAEQ